MSLRLIARKLELNDKKFITRDELKDYCKNFKLNYYKVIRYLIANKYLIRVLRGIFYVKSIEERKLNKTNITFTEAVEKAFKIKGITNWYFGLESAIKLNNLTHEFFAIEIIINDTISRPKPFEIFGVKVKFIKLNKRLFRFGILKNRTRYSDIEKTLLDLIYLGRYNNYSDEEIKNKISNLTNKCERKKIFIYAKYYPKTILKFLNKLKWQ